MLALTMLSFGFGLGLESRRNVRVELGCRACYGRGAPTVPRGSSLDYSTGPLNTTQTLASKNHASATRWPRDRTIGAPTIRRMPYMAFALLGGVPRLKRHSRNCFAYTNAIPYRKHGTLDDTLVVTPVLSDLLT